MQYNDSLKQVLHCILFFPSFVRLKLMNSVLFMDQIEDLYLLSGKEGVVIYFLVEGSDVTQYLMLIMLVIKAWYVTKQCVLPDQNFDGLFSIQNSKRPVSFGSVRERERERVR